MYAVTLGDDGAFGAEYVRPAAQSIPLGASGSMIEVRMNEDGSYSYMDGGQWLVITADSRMTAPTNGNVYRPLLAPDGRTPVGVMHVAAMQDVTLGALGGTLQLRQAEDMTWWLGDMQVMSGHVHTANGNQYVLTLDAAGMWSAVYQQNMVTVALGTQGSVPLTRNEDGSWMLGTEGVQAGSEVMSDSGNTYTLQYADGEWTARFEPESTAIEGTALVAMSKEDRTGYDVDGAELPASGRGDVTVDGAMYHVWMADGGLAGSRFGQAYKSNTYRSATATKIGADALRRPVLSADDPETVANEQGTHLLMTGPATTPTQMEEGRFSFADLLGRGMASDSGERFVAEAVETIERTRAEVAALLAIEGSDVNLATVLPGRWNTVKGALDDIFKTDSLNATEANRTSAVAMETPDEEDILADIDAILAALRSEEAFVAATAKDGGGVFDSSAGRLGAGAARDAFKRVKWTATATMGATGSTRYGTVLRKETVDAKTKLATTEYGAFSYSTMSETARTSDVVALTGIARYEGATEAIGAGGTTYSGTMDVQVRFNSNTVSGAVHGLVDQDAEPWQHSAAGVETIILSDAALQRDGEWHNSANDGSVFYTRDSGLLRPFTGLANSFAGRLLGRGSEAGSEASGVWSVGSGSNFLTGGFGVLRTGDITRQRPKLDDGDVAKAKLITTPANDMAVPQVSIGDGKLTVKVRAFGWVVQGDSSTLFQPLVDDKDTPGETDDVPVRVTAAFELAGLADESPGAETKISGPKHVDEVVKQLQASRDVLAALQALEDTDTDAAETAAWQAVQRAVRYQLFGGDLPVRLSGGYVEKEALGLIDQVLDALSSQSKLLAALDPEGTGIFDHYDPDPSTPEVEEGGNFIVYDSTDRRYETTRNRFESDGTTRHLQYGNPDRTLSQFLGEREYTVVATLGTTAYTRFGVWGSERVNSAERSPWEGGATRQNGVGTFAYSQLDPTPAGPAINPAFPVGGTASYEGETVARMGTNFLTGTARVDVNWAARSGGNALDFNLSDSISNAGLMSLTVSGLEDKNGEPLRTDAGQVADIVFANLPIGVGLKGANSGQLIVGAQGNADADGNYTYGEFAITDEDNLRYRFEDIEQLPDARRGADADVALKSVKALFVGQGVDGPLGVIGTWTLRDTSLGITNADGDRTANNTPIYGSFGADLP